LPALPACRACQNADGNETLAVREMMLGHRDRFDYVQCARCGALSISAVPADLGRYYPADYYSFAATDEARGRQLFAQARRVRTEVALRTPAAVARRLSSRREVRLDAPTPVARLRSRAEVPVGVRRLIGLGLTTRSRICDVGCGSGRELAELRRQGFRDLYGIDPFLAEDHLHAGDVALRRRHVRDLDGGWDLFTLHHVLEHLLDPAGDLRELAARLKADGAIVVGVPLADGWAARHYGPDWVQIDAPRHLMVPTVAAMGILAEAAGLRIERVTWDSWSLQFWGSEQYRLDIPLRSDEGYRPLSRGSGPFSEEQHAAWDRRAVELNRRRDGDAASFVLRHR